MPCNDRFYYKKGKRNSKGKASKPVGQKDYLNLAKAD